MWNTVFLFWYGVQYIQGNICLFYGVFCRSDESSAQTVACGPSPGHDRFSNGAILANQQRGFPSVRDGQHAEASDMHESDPEECSRTRSVLKRKANAAQRGWNGKLLLSREFEAAAAFLAKKQTFKPVKLKVTRTKRQVKSKPLTIVTGRSLCCSK